MTMLEDAELLRRYATERAEEAFAEIVRRHAREVYAFALRQVGGDAHLAADVTQVVFVALARKAAAVAQLPVLGGWLCRSTHFAARDVVRAERRRRTRELTAHIMHDPSTDPAPPVDWEKLHPVLAESLSDLSAADRDAVWLRFFEERSFAEIGARLRLTENAARMRLERALDKLHAALARRGVNSTAAAVGLALAQQAAVAAPAGLVTSVTTAVAAVGTGSGGWLGIFLVMNKLQIGTAAVAAVLGAAAVGWQMRANARLRAEIAALPATGPAMATLRAENDRLAATLREVEQLRRDDVELKRLEQTVTALRAAGIARSRTVASAAQPQLRVLSRPEQIAEKMLADEGRAKQEVERMNRELAVATAKHEQLVRRAQMTQLTAEQRAGEEQAAQTRAADLELKRREIQAFVDNVRMALTQRARVAREALAGEGELLPVPDTFPAIGGSDAAGARAGQPVPSP